MRNQWGLRFVDKTGSNYKTKTPLISPQLTTNKAFKRGSSFCSSSRSYLQNEDPIDFASFVVRGKASTRFDCLWFDRLRFWVLGLRSSFCRHLLFNELFDVSVGVHVTFPNERFISAFILGFSFQFSPSWKCLQRLLTFLSPGRLERILLHN